MPICIVHDVVIWHQHYESKVTKFPSRWWKKNLPAEAILGRHSSAEDLNRIEFHQYQIGPLREEQVQIENICCFHKIKKNQVTITQCEQWNQDLYERGTLSKPCPGPISLSSVAFRLLEDFWECLGKKKGKKEHVHYTAITNKTNFFFGL